MKKIPTLFNRTFENHKIASISDEVRDDLRWVLEGKGTATVKYDGSCCAIIDGVFYKRYDAKGGKPIPDGAIKCQNEPDPVTGHMPCWVKVDFENPSDKWFCSALRNCGQSLPDGTYEAIGKHFQGNPYKLSNDILVRHGEHIVEVERTFEGIREWLKNNNAEGLVFWKNNVPECKIKRKDFGIKWPAPDKVPSIIQSDYIKFG